MYLIYAQYIVKNKKRRNVILEFAKTKKTAEQLFASNLMDILEEFEDDLALNRDNASIVKGALESLSYEYHTDENAVLVFATDINGDEAKLTRLFLDLQQRISF